ncbi:MAG: chemotaxis protein CheW [Proteobacteria bacterium]|nr:chemotaxis protein CheW [Pseudomonadota bacterium]
MSSLPDLYTLIQNIDAELLEVMRSSGPVDKRSIPEQEKLTKYILVATGNLHLAIAIDDLSEVGPLPVITFLPNLPEWIQGIVNVRSEIISVIDFAGFLKLSGPGVCDGNRFVVLQHRKQKVGVRLDRIVGTVSRTKTDAKPIDFFDSNPLDTSLFTAGLLVDNKAYYILNVRRFLLAPSLIDFRSH